MPNDSSWHDHYRTLRQDMRSLRDQRSYRSVINRAYYALFALVTFRTSRQPPYNVHGWRNPEHSQVPGLVAQIAGIDAGSKEEIRKAVKSLYRLRVIADYQPWQKSPLQDAKEATRLAYTAFGLLGELK